MAALGWLLNLGFAASGQVAVESQIIVADLVTIADGVDDPVVLPRGAPDDVVVIPDLVQDGVIV